jgi:hypothetical protein
MFTQTAAPQVPKFISNLGQVPCCFEMHQQFYVARMRAEARLKSARARITPKCSLKTWGHSTTPAI